MPRPPSPMNPPMPTGRVTLWPGTGPTSPVDTVTLGVVGGGGGAHPTVVPLTAAPVHEPSPTPTDTDAPTPAALTPVLTWAVGVEPADCAGGVVVEPPPPDGAVDDAVSVPSSAGVAL